MVEDPGPRARRNYVRARNPRARRRTVHGSCSLFTSSRQAQAAEGAFFVAQECECLFLVIRKALVLLDRNISDRWFETTLYLATPWSGTSLSFVFVVDALRAIVEPHLRTTVDRHGPYSVAPQ
jgi:hypothetical protein